MSRLGSLGLQAGEHVTFSLSTQRLANVVDVGDANATECYRSRADLLARPTASTHVVEATTQRFID